MSFLCVFYLLISLFAENNRLFFHSNAFQINCKQPKLDTQSCRTQRGLFSLTCLGNGKKRSELKSSILCLIYLMILFFTPFSFALIYQKRFILSSFADSYLITRMNNFASYDRCLCLN